MTIKDFLKDQTTFDSYRKRRNWNGFIVYHIWAKVNKGACVGLPQFALDDGKTIRLADTDEIFKIMDSYSKKN